MLGIPEQEYPCHCGRRSYAGFIHRSNPQIPLSVKLSLGSREELVLRRTWGRELSKEGLDLKDPQL